MSRGNHCPSSAKLARLRLVNGGVDCGGDGDDSVGLGVATAVNRPDTGRFGAPLLRSVMSAERIVTRTDYSVVLALRPTDACLDKRTSGPTPPAQLQIWPVIGWSDSRRLARRASVNHQPAQAHVRARSLQSAAVLISAGRFFEFARSLSNLSVGGCPLAESSLAAAVSLSLHFLFFFFSNPLLAVEIVAHGDSSDGNARGRRSAQRGGTVFIDRRELRLAISAISARRLMS
uniref:Uncharacterized protein n=1 Tax=Plectus sambesii TaxID=2011161 RepID=A0A914VRU9_9BILA